MSVKRCVLKNIDSLDRLYDQMAAQLDFPAHFGRNLDALWDVLCIDLRGPIDISWPTVTADRIQLGDRYPAVEELFNDLTDERDDVTVRFG